MKKTILVLVVCIISAQLMAQNTKTGIKPPTAPPIELKEVPLPPPPPTIEQVSFTPPKIVKNKPAAPPKPPAPPRAPNAPKEEVKIVPPVIVKDTE